VRRRVITAAVALPIVLLAVFGGTIAVSCLAGAAAVVAGWELAGMARGGARRLPNFPLAAWPAAVVAMAATRATGASVDAWWPTAAAVGAGAVLAAGWFAVARTGSPAGWRAILLIIAAAYFGPLLAHAPLLRSLDSGLDWVLIALLTTFAVDTAAFFTGRSFGRRRLAPRISPGKTWEGAVGGVAGGAAAGIALFAIVDPGPVLWSGAVLGLAVAAAGTAGDLAESALKRAIGLKDSGTLLPGHGGILDRLDSLAPNLAVVYWFAVWTAT